ncbi:MAG: penicillin-binding protein 1A [Pseudomonadota bacterium]
MADDPTKTPPTPKPAPKPAQKAASDAPVAAPKAPERTSAAPLAAPERPPAYAEPPVKKSSGGGFLGLAIEGAGLVVAVGILGLVGAMAFSGLYLNRLAADLPDYEVLADYEPPVTTRVYAGDGTLVAEFARERRLFVPIDVIPSRVKNAFVSAEDKNFYNHSGLDVKGVVRAQISNVSNIAQGRRLEGGSTITQQVAKVFLLSSEQRLDRKLKEWLVTRRIEKAFTKDQILELYLNEIYLGNRSYGVAAAALNYFDKSLDELDVHEAAYLAAIPKGPSNYHPVRNRDRAIERRNWVIGRLRDDGHLTPEEAKTAQDADLGAEIAPPLGARDWASEYFAEEVRKQTAALYGVEALYDGGLAVRTTVNPSLQRAAGNALRKWLVEYDQRHGWRGAIDQISLGDDWAETFAAKLKELADVRKVADDLSPWRTAVVLSASKSEAKVGFEDGSEGAIPLENLVWARAYESVDELKDEISAASDVLSEGDIIFVEASAVDGVYHLRQAPAVNGGLVAIDPHTGRVLAMVGGFSFQMSEFNRALQARRQPGSTFKPFVYSVALDSGYTPASIVLDAPFVAPGEDSWYKPGNYVEGRYGGESTLRHGIEKSRNTMTARLAQDLGIGRIMDYVERFNLSDTLPRELAISLGSGETTLDRITAAYATFVNGGKETTPFIIDRVQDRNGKTIYKHDKRVCQTCNTPGWTDQPEPQLADLREQIVDPRTAYQMVSMLQGVVQRGTGSAVRKVIDHPIAGKTGTTNDYKDAWFVGFSPDLAAGVYVGFDLPQSLGRGEAGGTVAAPIFAEFMADALKEEPAIPFRVPSGIRLVRVNAKTGKPAGPGDGNVILEAFKAEDVLAAGSLTDDVFSLDPLSAAPSVTPEEPEEELEGLF